MANAYRLQHEHTRICDRLPALARRITRVEYHDDHVIAVVFSNSRAVSFDVRDWMSDECLARIALEAP